MNSINTFNEESFRQSVNRRSFLTRSAYGLGGLALASLFNPKLIAGETAARRGIPGFINPLHFPPKAKRVIHQRRLIWMEWPSADK